MTAVSTDPIQTPSSQRQRSLLSRLFLSPAERRLRAGWRLMLQVALQLIILTITGLVLVASLPRVFSPAAGPLSSSGIVAAQIAELVAITLSVFVARRLLDRRTFISLGLRPGGPWMTDFAAGMAITFGMMAFIFAAEWALGWLEPTGFAWQMEPLREVALEAGIFMLICLLVGWNEELMSRGYHLQTLASGMNLTWGLILSSSVFGILHLANPHANPMAVAGILLAGLFLGYAYIRTGQLWLSIGLHTGWNFFEGVVFGFPVSGLPFYRLTHTAVSGPSLWTGGEFGPEAGLILIPALALGFVLVHAYGRGRPAQGP